jgi:sterol desaturase/sphingolipid hydroxylase (fatty acid hydroxylase superfamily)
MKTLKSLGWWLSFAFACALVLVVSGYGHLQAFVNSHHELTRFLLLAFLLTVPARLIALFAAYLIDLLLVGWERSSVRLLWRPEASVRLDIISILVMLLLPQRQLGWLLSFGLLYLLDVFLTRHLDISLTGLLPFWALQILALTLLQSFLRYWLHRLQHSIPALWALHKFHHSADRMTLLTSSRNTQFGKAVESGLVFLPAALLTHPTAAVPAFGSAAFIGVAIIFTYHSFIIMNGYLCHSNLGTDYGWMGRWLVVSPRMHRLHHATRPEFHNRNFSNDLVIWDRLFGTYVTCDAADVAMMPIGLDDNPFNRQATFAGALREYFLTTFVVFWRELRRGLQALVPARLTTTRAPSGV